MNRLLLSVFTAFLLSAPITAHAAPAKLCVHVDTSQLCDASGETADLPQAQFASLDVLEAAGSARPVCGLGTSPSCPRGVYQLLDIDSMLVQSAGFDLAVFTVDAGPVADKPAPLPDPETDPAGVLREIGSASKDGRWLVAFALVLWVVVKLGRKYGAKLWPYLGETKGGMYLAFFTGLAATAAVQLYTGKLDWGVTLDGILAALAAIGVHHTGRDVKQAS
jgi:hypothetical protein